jgi:hypothetical protein
LLTHLDLFFILFVAFFCLLILIFSSVVCSLHSPVLELPAVRRAQRRRSLVVGRCAGDRVGGGGGGGSAFSEEARRDSGSIFSGSNRLTAMDGGGGGSGGGDAAAPAERGGGGSGLARSIAGIVTARGLAKRLKEGISGLGGGGGGGGSEQESHTSGDALRFDVDWRSKFELGAPRLPESTVLLEVWARPRFGADVLVGSGTVELEYLARSAATADADRASPFDARGDGAQEPWGVTVQVPIEVSAALRAPPLRRRRSRDAALAPQESQTPLSELAREEEKENDVLLRTPSVLLRLSLAPPIDVTDGAEVPASIASIPGVLRSMADEFMSGRCVSGWPALSRTSRARWMTDAPRPITSLPFSLAASATGRGCRLSRSRRWR